MLSIEDLLMLNFYYSDFISWDDISQEDIVRLELTWESPRLDYTGIILDALKVKYVG